jgi:hypothetical protein
MTEAACTTLELRPPALPETPLNTRAESWFALRLMFLAIAVSFLLQSASPGWSSSFTALARGGFFETSAVLLTATVASVTIHEIGHLIPSLLFGFYVSRVSIGPISASRVHGHWKLQYSRALLSASVSALPADRRAWRTRMLLVVTGGPLATLGAFVVAACVIANSAPAMPVPLLWSALFQINLLLFVLGLIPNNANSRVRNDARLFLVLVKNDNYTEQIRLYHELMRLQIAGVRPSEYPRELISHLAKAHGNYDLMLFSASSIFRWALDSGQIAIADSWDVYANGLMQLAPLRLSGMMLAESAVFDLLYRNLPGSAARKLAEVKLETLPPWLRERAKATLQVAHGLREQAIATIAEARGILSPAVSYFQFEARLLDLIENRAIITDSRTFGASAA